MKYSLLFTLRLVFGMLGCTMLTAFATVGLLTWHSEKDALIIAIIFMIMTVFGLGWNGLLFYMGERMNDG